MSFQVFSAVTGDLLLQTQTVASGSNEDVVQYLKEQIFLATGVPKFCQQLITESNDIIHDEKSWDLCGKPMDLKVAFQVASKHLGQELLDSAAAGHEDKVKVILEQFQDPNVIDGAGETPILKAEGMRGGKALMDYNQWIFLTRSFCFQSPKAEKKHFYCEKCNFPLNNVFKVAVNTRCHGSW